MHIVRVGLVNYGEAGRSRDITCSPPIGLKLTRGQLHSRAKSAAFGLSRSLQLLLSKQGRHALITDLIEMATWAEEAPERCVYSTVLYNRPDCKWATTKEKSQLLPNHQAQMLYWTWT
jgi:hypothetical protein